MPCYPGLPGSKPSEPKNRTDQLVETFTRQMRETYVLLGKSLIPLMEDKPEDIDTLIELGGVYEQLGCLREAATAYERLRQLNPRRLPKHAQAFLERHSELIEPKNGTPSKPNPDPIKGEPT